MKRTGSVTLLEELELAPVINAFETVTRYGGSIMYPECIQAMEEIRGSFVDVVELNRAVSRKIALLTGNQTAFVTSGCAAAISLTAAAAVIRRGLLRPHELPFQGSPERRPNVLVHRGQRNPYDRAILLSGAEIREFGYPTHQATPGQLEQMIDDRSVALFYFAGRIFERYALPLETAAAICRTAGIPMVVDAAAQVPPRGNLSRYTRLGADLALFSGGKGIRGPQDSGLVVGDQELISIVESIASPNQEFGRAMKTSREAIAGLLAALRALFAEDEETVYLSRMQRARALAARIGQIGEVDVTVLPDGRHGQLYPRVAVRLPEESGLEREHLMAELAAGTPPVIVGPLDEDSRSIYFNMFAVTDEEVPLAAAAFERAFRLRGTTGRN